MAAAESKANYDSRGFHSGLAVGDIFADLEVQMIANRKKIYRDAQKENNFLQGVLRRLDAYRQANSVASQNALADARRLAIEELTQSNTVGKQTVDRVMDYYQKQGYDPPTKPMENTILSGNALIAGIFTTLTAFSATASYAQTAAEMQLMQIVLLANPAAEDLDAEIDRVQATYLAQGIPGAIDRAGREKDMTVQSEFIMRDQSHKTLTAAEGERSREYGQYLIQVSAHPSSCPLCVPWQGKILVDDLSGGTPDGVHELLSVAIEAGLNHYNCRHNWVTHIPGFSSPDIFEHDKASPEETAKRYEIEERQRYNERTIREYKRRAEGSMSEIARRNAEQKVAEWQARQRELARIAEAEGLPFYRQYSREQIGGETRPTINRYM